MEEKKLRKLFSHTNGKSLLSSKSLILLQLPLLPAERAEGAMLLAETQLLFCITELSGLAFVPATTSVGTNNYCWIGLSINNIVVMCLCLHMECIVLKDWKMEEIF